jgi:isoleucyl-tRNA synthetase
VVSMGRNCRNTNKLKTRQPLKEILIITRHPEDRQTIERYSTLIAQELNVKKVSFSAEETRWVNLVAKPNFKSLGQRVGSKMKAISQKIRELSPEGVATLEQTGKLEIEGEIVLPSDILIERQPKQEGLIQSVGQVTVWLDTKLDEALISEGRARELVNRIQKLRKDLGFDVTDRIRVGYACPAELKSSIERFNAYVAEETLASEIREVHETVWTAEQEIDDLPLKLKVEKV